MTWLLRLGALCVLLGAFACTGNPKPLPPGTEEDGNMPQPDATVSQDATTGSDAFVPNPDASTDAGDASTDAGTADGAVDGGSDAVVDGGEQDAAGRPQLDAGLFVPDGAVRRKDGGPSIPPPPSPND